MRTGIFALTLFVIPLLSFAQNSVIEGILKGTVLITGLSSQGSGILVDSSGIVVTNYHVIEDNLDLEVLLPNGDSYSPNGVIAFDAAKDIALLKISGFDLPSVDFGNSNSVAIGNDVLITGAPQGMEQTLSRGIISGIRDSGKGFTLFQTDAAISEGSSGGGMFSPDGDLIGITVSSLTEGQNLNFVVPINYVRGLMGEEIAFTIDEFNALSPSIAASNLSNYSNSYDFLESYVASLEDEYGDGDDKFIKTEDAWFLISDEYTIYFRTLGDLSFIIGSMLDYTPADFSRDSLRRLLSASYAANFAKVGFDSEGDMEVLIEIMADNATFESTSEMLNNIILLADEVIEIAESNIRDLPLDSNAEISVAGIDFGDNSSQWANDGECDDPRFEGGGMATQTNDDDLRSDATDCSEAYQNGSIALSQSLDDISNDNLVANRTYLDGSFEMYLDDSVWEVSDSNTEGGAITTVFQSQEFSGVYLQIVEELGLDIGSNNLDNIMTIISPELEYSETKTLNIRGNSIWNGVANAVVDDLNFTFNFLAYSGPSGLIQIQSWAFDSELNVEILRKIANEHAQSVRIN